MDEIYTTDLSVRKILGDIVGVSPVMVRLRRAIRKIAKTNENVLLLGEPGVGKRFLSHKIHLLSPRRAEPFVEVDCGLRNGGFTNGKEASHDNFIREKLQKAGNGTLALYQIENFNSNQQRQLLWHLNEASAFQNGKGNTQIFPRIVATCALDAKNAIAKKHVDAKLFYRLGKVMITVPPLRNRKQDIPYLFQHFLENFQQNGNEYAFTGVSDELYDSLLSYEWQGNVDELQNSARSLLMTTENGVVIPEALPFLKDSEPFKSLIGKSLPDAISQVEKYLMKVALGKFEGNQTKAAQYLKISEASLRYKLKKYGICNK